MKPLHNIYIYILTMMIMILSVPTNAYAARLSGIAYVNSTLPSNQFSPFGDGTGNCFVDGSYHVAGSTTTKKEGNMIRITTDIFATNDRWGTSGYAAGRILVLCFDDNDLTGYERWLNNGKYIQLNFRNNKFVTNIQMTRIANGNTLTSRDKTDATTYMDSYNRSHGLTGSNAFRISAGTVTNYHNYSYTAQSTFDIYNLPANCKKIYILPIGIPNNHGQERDSKAFYMPPSWAILNSNSVKITLGYTITFNANGATTTPTRLEGAEVVTLPTVSRPGYTFDGWYNGSTRIGGAGDKWKPTADATITAHWTPIIYRIQYLTYGGIVTGNPITYTVETPDFTLKNPIQLGMLFKGWSDKDNSKPNTEYTISKGSIGDITISANWKSNDTDHGRDYSNDTTSNRFTVK